ncbi:MULTISPECIES: hypothetical protein [Streptomyces]|uniref:Uncharacterized protein n=1 Tax=Streptomyces venezuelae (strain ATCC 10712 / CBS 650.69 / DSM 40230 / JCM 4526 / NBRC 13096 / PD 04745) TaxID=953739 RepID=F2RCK3_STRVP|nr:hypothetical protein [Streptomyces venezuelae]APE20463.1 hypothetical protein vnz_05210 [Streptomyces venezuelae]QER97855.1 hypothetical protein DEJ43_05260 [Streptomyces venezuelae ATCC 10712]CCA54361.1 hypothetical protein SVEN_1074 [Streptomyces venezuelae ATCC 10712]
MSESTWTGVQGSTGPLNTGTGDQHNHLTQNYFHDVAPPGAPPLRPLAADHLRWLDRRFVPPFGMTDAQDVLSTTGTLLLDGAPGSGRNATARVLLHRTPGPRVPRTITVDRQDADAELDGSYLGEGDRLLLDLADAGPDRWEAAHDRLPALHQVVQERGARLVVIVPHGTTRLSNELAAHRRTIVRPSGWVVLSLALRCDDFPLAEHIEELTGQLHARVTGDRPMGEVARLARLLGEARRSAPRGSAASWCAAALADLHDLAARAASAFGDLSDGRARALLFTTAMLSGTRPEALHAASEELLKEVGHPEDHRPLLEQEDLAQRFVSIRAFPRDDGTVAFETADYAAAVRTHFWRHLPGMRPAFRAWVDRSVRLLDLTSYERDTLIACCAEQCLAAGQYEPLLALAQEWAGDGPPRLVQAAIQILGHGLSDAGAGRTFRQRVYDWATDARVPSGLAGALVSVSAEVIASTHPDQALVRLHHLARRAPDGEDGARVRLLTLALAEPRLHRLLLVRLADDLSRHRWLADVSLFRACAAPGLLLAPATDGRPVLEAQGLRVHVAGAWRALLAHRPETEWLPLAEEWMTAAGRTAAHQDILLDLLVRAAEPSPAALARLYTLSLRHRYAQRLRRKIDAAQGFKTVPSSF